MARPWRRSHEFDSLYERFICQDEMQFGGRAFICVIARVTKNVFSDLRRSLRLILLMSWMWAVGNWR